MVKWEKEEEGRKRESLGLPTLEEQLLQRQHLQQMRSAGWCLRIIKKKTWNIKVRDALTYLPNI